MKVDLTFFADLDASNKCFPGAATTQLFAATISQKNIKGGIKQAIASWWFEARTTDDKAYNYVLQMFGEFPPDTVWPGDVTLDMVNWEMNDASGNGETTQTACLGEDVFVTTIIVN